MTEYDDENDIDDLQIDEYRISTTPNDFNITTIKDFLDKGIFEIPLFQRNYVWDIKMASKLIESLIMGLPIPQVFLWQTDKNKMAIIDGQQRLMSIYFFKLGRFPKKNKVVELRKKMKGNAVLEKSVLADDYFFTDFKLTFKKDNNTKLNGLKYETLDDLQTAFDMRTLRSIVIRQEDPKDNSSMYEIFSRLNTGGTSLKYQEVRMSLNQSDFFEMLKEINENEVWRDIYGKDYDKNCSDIEYITRAFALLLYSDKYSSSMVQFLNNFSEAINYNHNNKIAAEKRLSKQYENDFLKKTFEDFLSHCKKIGLDAFKKDTGSIDLVLFEACFYAAYIETINSENPAMVCFTKQQVKKIGNNEDFKNTRIKATNTKENIMTRLKIASSIIKSE
jgi:hypothetical protein